MAAALELGGRLRQHPDRSSTDMPNKHDTVLYMFSGQDFLYATSFFPNASTYVLSGLEPVGDIPQLIALDRASRP